jgi:hypothetical protein
MTEEFFVLGPSLRCASLSWFSSVSSLSSISLFLWTVSRDMSNFTTPKASSFPHHFFSLFDRESIDIHCIRILHLLIVWTVKPSSCAGCLLSSIIACFAKYGHLSSVVVIKLDRFRFPTCNCCWYCFSVKDLLE